MIPRVLALATATGLLWAAPASGLEAAAGPPASPRDRSPAPAIQLPRGTPELGQPPASEPGAPEPRAPEGFDGGPPVDDQVLLQYAQALSDLLRVAEIARQQELQALHEAGLTEEEFIVLSQRILGDPQVRRRLEEHLARQTDDDRTLAAQRTGHAPRR